jgi:hypothetical protein
MALFFALKTTVIWKYGNFFLTLGYVPLQKETNTILLATERLAYVFPILQLL